MKNKIKSDSELLISIVEDKLHANPLDKKRKRNTVDARMIFSKILREKGYSLKLIGGCLGKDHSTIIHYVRAADIAIELIEEFKNNYSYCKKQFFTLSPNFINETTQNYIKQSIRIDDKINELNNIIEQLNNKENILTSLLVKYNRLKNTVDLIDSKTNPGDENKIFCLVNALFNDNEKFDR
jgi:hypothetical protein